MVQSNIITYATTVSLFCGFYMYVPEPLGLYRQLTANAIHFFIYSLSLQVQCTFFLLQDDVKEIIEKKQTVGVAKLRLLPRVGGVRLIANMGSCLNLPFTQVNTIKCIQLTIVAHMTQQVTTTGKQERSINSKLQNVFHVLNYEKVTWFLHVSQLQSVSLKW